MSILKTLGKRFRRTPRSSSVLCEGMKHMKERGEVMVLVVDGTRADGHQEEDLKETRLGKTTYGTKINGIDLPEISTPHEPDKSKKKTDGQISNSDVMTNIRSFK